MTATVVDEHTFQLTSSSRWKTFACHSDLKDEACQLCGDYLVCGNVLTVTRVAGRNTSVRTPIVFIVRLSIATRRATSNEILASLCAIRLNDCRHVGRSVTGENTYVAVLVLTALIWLGAALLSLRSDPAEHSISTA